MEERSNFWKLFGLLQVKDVTPLRLSQQYEAQEFHSDKVYYVPGGLRCRFFFLVEATNEIRIRPASLLNRVRQVHGLTPICPTTETWLPHLNASAVDATERYGGILGYFTIEQTYCVEDIFEDIGEPVPWPSTIY